MQLSDVDLTNADIFEQAVPHDMFRVLRNEAPVFWHEEKDGPGFWAITKYDDVKYVGRHPRVYSSEKMGTLMREPLPEELPHIQSIMLNMDPPKHRRYRGIVSKAFCPRMIDNLHGRVREMVKGIINNVIERGECDFVEDIAAQLPLEVICEMMGVPHEDRRGIYDIGNQMVGFDDPEYYDENGRPMRDKGPEEAFAEMFVYAEKLREIAIKHPTDNLATGLLNAEMDGEKLSETDFNFFFLLLLIAGNETTRTVTSNGMIALLDNPDQLAAVRADLTLLPGTIEEILRYAPAVHCFRRQALADSKIRGQRIEKDQKVMVWYPAANRDEEVFANADAFDIRRSPNDHVAFGFGEHFCLGANLARLELNEIFRGILMRIHDIKRTAPPRRLRSTFINGVKEMQIRFQPGAVER